MPPPVRSLAGSYWTLDLRNMLVHRVHRIELGQYLPITPALLGPDGNPAPRACCVSHLPRDPGRSDIEVFVDTPWNMVLHEEGTQTLRGLMNSTQPAVRGGRKAPARSLVRGARIPAIFASLRNQMEERAFEAVDGLQRLRAQLAASRTQHGDDASGTWTALSCRSAR